MLAVLEEEGRVEGTENREQSGSSWAVQEGVGVTTVLIVDMLAALLVCPCDKHGRKN